MRGLFIEFNIVINVSHVIIVEAHGIQRWRSQWNNDHLTPHVGWDRPSTHTRSPHTQQSYVRRGATHFARSDTFNSLISSQSSVFVRPDITPSNVPRTVAMQPHEYIARSNETRLEHTFAKKKKYHRIRRKSSRYVDWKSRWQNVRKFKQYTRSLVKVLRHSVSWQHRDQRYTIYYVAVRENTDPQLQQIEAQLMQLRFHRTRVDQLFLSKTNRHPTHTPKEKKRGTPGT